MDKYYEAEKEFAGIVVITNDKEIATVNNFFNLFIFILHKKKTDIKCQSYNHI